MPPVRQRRPIVLTPLRPQRTRAQNKRSRKIRAYRSSRKKRMMIARAPLVETKSRTGEEMAIQLNDSLVLPDPTTPQDIPVDDAVTQMPLDPYNWMSQGLGEDQMIGLSVYSKYIKQKLQFTLPTGANAIDFPCNLYVVHGWIKNPFARTSSTTPSATDATYSQFNHDIFVQLKEFFDEKEDKLRFIPKANNQIKILGYKKLRPNRNQSIAPPTQVFGTSLVPSGYKTAGAFGPINVSLTWRVMRKVHYTPGPSHPNLPYFYNNESWRPFSVLYNPDFAQWATYPNTGPIKVASNTCHWYSDS